MASETAEKKTQLSAKETDQVLEVKDRLSSFDDKAKFDKVKDGVKKLNEMLIHADIVPDERVVNATRQRAKAKGFSDEASEMVATAVGLLSTVTEEYPEFDEAEHKKLAELIEPLLKSSDDAPPGDKPTDPISNGEFEKLSKQMNEGFKEMTDTLKSLANRINKLEQKGKSAAE